MGGQLGSARRRPSKRVSNNSNKPPALTLLLEIPTLRKIERIIALNLFGNWNNATLEHKFGQGIVAVESLPDRAVLRDCSNFAFNRYFR